MQTQALVIAEVEILQDGLGRYNLNCLHQASGGKRGKEPSQWLRRQETQELITEWKSQNVNLHSDAVTSAESSLTVINGGNNSGVWATEEIAVAYATWISPAFQLVVIRAFLDFKQGRFPLSGAQALRIIADQLDAQGIEIVWMKGQFNLFTEVLGGVQQVLGGVQQEMGVIRTQSNHTQAKVISMEQWQADHNVVHEKSREAVRKSKQREGPTDLYKWLWDQQDGLCIMCGSALTRNTGSPDDAQIDEILPVCDGGIRNYSNTQLLHGRCNRRKGTHHRDYRTPEHRRAGAAEQAQCMTRTEARDEQRRRQLTWAFDSQLDSCIEKDN